MANVKTDYVDYALKPVGSGNPVSLRKFETYNATTGALASTIYVKDVTDYATVGSNILASDLNTIGNAVNSNSANIATEKARTIRTTITGHLLLHSTMPTNAELIATVDISALGCGARANYVAYVSIQEFVLRWGQVFLYTYGTGSTLSIYALYTSPVEQDIKIDVFVEKK